MGNGAKVLIGCGVLLGIMLITGFVVFAYGVSNYNSIMGLENMAKAKQKDNENEFDGMFKKISQVAQVTEKDRSTLKDIFVQQADARTNKNSNSVMNWIKESVPNVSSELFANLQNIIVSSRDRWTMRQKELLDIKREHDNYRTKFPTNILCGMFGIKELKVQIVTSSRTEKAFETGKDDDTSVFSK